MKFDLAVALVTATAVSAAAWAYMLVQRRRWAANGDDATLAPESPGPVTVTAEFLASLFPVFLFVLLIRSFAFEPYRIPSDSMVPTLLHGDFIFVSKYAYGIRLPISHKLVAGNGKPERGDVAVFRKPSNPSINFIKRVVGLPGDEIVYRNKRLYINGVEQQLIQGESFSDGRISGNIYAETLEGVEHAVVLNDRDYPVDFRYKVQAGCYFMMGDSRDNSRDSRFPDVGCVPETNLVGRASIIWLNWKWGDSPRWGRIGDKIR